jgi:hypothetical protein
MGRFSVMLCAAALLAAALPAPLAAVTTTIESQFTGAEPQMPDRMFRDGSPSTCEMAPFPGLFASRAYWQSFRFCASSAQTCVTATYDEGNCGDEVHLMAYRGSFNPEDLTANYAGDTGASDSLPFSFVVSPSGPFYIVAQTNFGLTDCQFGFMVEAGPCSTGAPLLSGAGGIVLVGGALLLLGVATLRRPRQALAGMALIAAVAVSAGPAVAPVGAGSNEPPPNVECLFDCGEVYSACASTICNSGPVDNDPNCLQNCSAAHDMCVQGCLSES